MGILSLSLLLLVVLHNHVNPLHSRETCSARYPAPFVATCKNIRESTLSPAQHKRQVSVFLFLSLLLAGDVQSNPGPHRQISTYPCGMCEQNVSWTDCVACDDCSVWYHRSCLELCTADFRHLQNSKVNWICHKCDSINCDTFTFNNYSLESSNYYQPLADLSVDSLGSVNQLSPLKTSSPKIRDASSLGRKSTEIPSPQAPDGDKCKGNKTPFDISFHGKESLRLLNINCHSVVGNRTQLLAMMQYLKPDIVCGTESWLGPKHLSSEIFPTDYVAYRRDRSTGWGGIFILIHKSLVSSAAPELDTDCEILWTKVHLQSNKDIAVGCFYMPQRSHKDLAELKTSLEKVTSGQRQQQILLAGDFNCPDVNWDKGAVPPGAPDRPIQQELVDITTEAQLTQVHDQSTREKNLIDVVFMSNPSLVKNTTSVPGICDHDAVVTDINTRPQRIKEKPRRIFQYSKADWDKINQEMEQAADRIQNLDKEGTDVNRLWTEFKDTVTSALERNVPSKLQRRNKNLPWVNAGIQRLLRKKKRLHRQAKKTGNWSNYRFFQKECRREMRKAEWAHINATIEEGLKEKNTKPFWRYIKSRRQDNIGVAPLKDGPSLHSDSISKARILLKQFCSVFTEGSNAPLPTMSGTPYPDLDPLTVNTKGVEKLLRNLNPSKATGPDNIPTRLLKTCSKTIAPILTTIYNKSMKTGQLPTDWLSANISAIYKKGDRNRAENYRPVSLTSVACKVLEHIISHHLREHLEKHGILTSQNHGFRSGYSCETQLLTTMSDLFESFDSGKQVDVAILDLSKAFDTVPHDKLMHKLEHYGIRGPAHLWITNFLTKRKMQVILEGEKSEQADVKSGVPQGTVLGPLLFLCHLNDLPDAVQSQVRLFADDCLLYREINNFQDHLALQEDLCRLERWAKTWGMRFNASKCTIMSIRQKSHYLYKLDGTPLKQVQESPYLGVQLSADLKWSTHITNICKKAGSIVGFLRRNLRNCPKECRRLAYISLVRSKLDYAAVVWDPYQKQDIDRLERIQRQAARFITKDYKSRNPGCITKMLEDLNLPPLEERRKQQRLKLLHKIAEGQIPALPVEKFLKPAKVGRRKIRPKRYSDHNTDNIIERQAINNSRGFLIPNSNTEQHRNSFFMRTALEWNQLSDEDILVGPASAAPSAQGGKQPWPTQTHH